MCIHGLRVASSGSHDGCGRHDELETHFCAHRTLSQHQMAAIEIGNDRTVPINERRARVDGVLISLVTEGMDDCPHLYPEAQDKEIEQRAPRRVHCSGCCNHD